MDRPDASDAYHEGERVVQERVGVLAEAAALARLAGQTRIPAKVVPFLESQIHVVAATVGAGGRRAAWLVWDDRPVLRVLDDGRVVVSGARAALDPVAVDVAATGALGLLAIEWATRRRVKLKGQGRTLPDGTLLLEVGRAYALCPRYIRPRVPDAILAPDPSGPTLAMADGLSDAQRRLVETSDTFILATHHPASGADASHRGGDPGFVRAPDAHMIEFDDQPGNNMFNSLGNIEADPRAGLLFIDFATATTLHLSGVASVDWPRGAEAGPRVVRLAIERVEELRGGGGLVWRRGSGAGAA